MQVVEFRLKKIQKKVQIAQGFVHMGKGLMTLSTTRNGSYYLRPHCLSTFSHVVHYTWHYTKFFEHKPFDSSFVMGFGVLNDLSLGFNSVGFNQDEAVEKGVEFMDFYSINQSLMALSKFQGRPNLLEGVAHTVKYAPKGHTIKEVKMDG